MEEENTAICVYKGKGKLNLPSTYQNSVPFALYQLLFCYVNSLFIKFEIKRFQSGGGGGGVREGPSDYSKHSFCRSKVM